MPSDIKTWQGRLMTEYLGIRNIAKLADTQVRDLELSTLDHTTIYNMTKTGFMIVMDIEDDRDGRVMRYFARARRSR
jgi:hypothetical protein